MLAEMSNEERAEFFAAVDVLDYVSAVRVVFRARSRLLIRSGIHARLWEAKHYCGDENAPAPPEPQIATAGGAVVALRFPDGSGVLHGKAVDDLVTAVKSLKPYYGGIEIREDWFTKLLEQAQDLP